MRFTFHMKKYGLTSYTALLRILTAHGSYNKHFLNFDIKVLPLRRACMEREETTAAILLQ